MSHYLDVRDNFKTAYASYLANPVGDAPVYSNPGRFYLSGMSIGGGYQDECTTVSVNYIVSPTAAALGTSERNRTVLLRLELKTLARPTSARTSGPRSPPTASRRSVEAFPLSRPGGPR